MVPPLLPALLSLIPALVALVPVQLFKYFVRSIRIRVALQRVHAAQGLPYGHLVPVPLNLGHKSEVPPSEHAEHKHEEPNVNPSRPLLSVFPKIPLVIYVEIEALVPDLVRQIYDWNRERYAKLVVEARVLVPIDECLVWDLGKFVAHGEFRRNTCQQKRHRRLHAPADFFRVEREDDECQQSEARGREQDVVHIPTMFALGQHDNMKARIDLLGRRV
mmetsp:Transcript_72800/g.207391  ORF Transcript_72800/g.207391 Transcript_72800/m.207391 type:complete len:218 (-) Transcript_72800:791-1444(-)